jgi:endonuclease YncB( thermonuclease family)
MDVGEAFVGTGMARAYLDQTDAYLAAEEAAKAAGLGVWQAGAKVDDPWAWRKRNPGGFR